MHLNFFSCIQTTKEVAEATGFLKSTRVSAPAPLTAGCQVPVCPDPSMEMAPEPRTAGGASWSWCHPDTKDMLEEYEPAETWCSSLFQSLQCNFKIQFRTSRTRCGAEVKTVKPKPGSSGKPSSRACLDLTSSTLVGTAVCFYSNFLHRNSVLSLLTDILISFQKQVSPSQSHTLE